MVETNTLDAERTRTIDEWFGLSGALGFFGAICILGYQAFLWLKDGQWTPIPISSILGKLNIDYYSLVDISWAGAQTIVVWLLDLPFSVGMVVFGGLIGVLIGYLINKISFLRK